MNLQGKKVVILGGTSGIGFATAKAVSELGGISVIASSNAQRVQAALKELPNTSAGYTVDLANETQIKNLFDQIGNFDHLVYTAGENISACPVLDADIERSKDFFTLRFWGAFMSIKYGVPFINTGGSINLMGGSFGQRPAAGYSLGSVMCGAIDAFTRAMAVELAPIRVNNVAAGVTKTNLWNGMNELDRNSFFNHLENTLLVKRVGEAEDIAKAFVYLMVQQQTTGQSLVTDGGSVLV